MTGTYGAENGQYFVMKQSSINDSIDAINQESNSKNPMEHSLGSPDKRLLLNKN